MNRQNFRRNIRHWCLGLVFLMWASSAFAQAVVRGAVTDAETNGPLPGANVIITGGNVQTGAATFTTGEFEIKNVPAGTYTVTVSFIGYETQTLTDVAISQGQTKTLDIALTPKDIEFNPISITASRRPEKVLEAPASITVMEAEAIEARPVLTPTEHLKALPAVDVVSAGMVQSNVVVRGFNNIFSGALLTLVDNRIARVPSLRLNENNFIPTTNEDIERYEIVLGPGSALYGPNAASGVFHMVTKSPIGSEGTEINVGGGERDLLMASGRHAGSFNDKFGYKFSAQYYKATDWKYNDPAEPGTIVKFLPTAEGPIPTTGPISNQRDFDIEKIAGEARFDYRPTDDFSTVLTAGFNRGSQIELTGIGAAQAIDWTYSFVQARFNYKDLFIQGFVNRSDAGDTFILRSGQLIIDKSKLFVGQVQHSYELGKRQRFTYGVDALITRPNTEGTINGNNENSDDINEFGAYLQSETDLTAKLKFVGAARVDDHSELENPVFSPRAALVFKPTATDNFRVTFNRAFSTPTTNNLFLDILQAPDAFGIGAAFQPAFGFSPAIDIRAQGVPKSGFNFRKTPDGRFMFRSPFAPAAGLQSSDFIPLNDPLFTNAMWGIGSGAVTQGFLPQYQAGLKAAGFDDATVAALSSQFAAIVPQTVSGVNNVMLSLDPETESFFPDVPVDVPRIKQETTQTIEFGYKGVVREKLALGVDVYHTKIEDFISPLLVVTPNVFLDPATLSAYLGQSFATALARPENATLNATLVGGLDAPARGGNGNGSAVDELTQIYTSGAAQIPFGTVSPQEAFDPTAVIVTYRNFGEVNITGFDLSLSYYMNRHWTVTGNYSFVNNNLFKNLGGIDDVAMNAPKHKFGGSLAYRSDESGFDGKLRLRWVDSFPVISAAFKGISDRFAVLDLNLNYKLPFGTNTAVNLTIQNLTDNKHREIIGAPEIGRLAILQLRQSL